MGMTNAQFAILLARLLPPGAAWARSGETSSSMYKLLQGIADEFLRIEGRGEDLRNELDPSTATELLPEWESLVQIPDFVQDMVADTVAERRQDIVRKVTARGGQSPQYFIDLAANFGLTITITRFRPFRSGRARAGDRVYGTQWAFTWQVNVPSQAREFFRAGGARSGDPLSHWQNEKLEAAIREKAPSHGYVLFSYAS